MSSDQYYPAGNNNNPIKSLSSASKTSNQSGFPAYEINFINPHASYYALNFIDIISKGKDYPYSTTPYIASPEHPNGNPCSVSISFGLNVSSILMTSGGINHSVGDLYSIFNSQKNNDPAILRVLEVDTNGTITSFSIQDSGSGFNNDGIYVVCKSYSVNSYDDCATFSLVQDKFCIADIVINDGGSGYDYFDNEGIVQNRQIVLSNSGGGYGFLAHISTQPVLINNEYKFPPKTHTSLDESNIVISNGIGSSSSSLYSYVLTDCEYPELFQYVIFGTNINLEINKAYKLNTFELDYGEEKPVDTDRCYLVSNYDFNFYSELSSIQVVSGPYDSCENCPSSSPSPSPTPTPPAPTPPYALSSSSSSSFSLCGQEKDSSNSELYLLAAILSAAGGILSSYGAYKILDKYLPDDVDPRVVKALDDPSKLIERITRDIRATYRYNTFGNKAAEWTGHEIQRQNINTPRVWNNGFLLNQLNNAEPIRFIKYASEIPFDGSPANWQIFEVPTYIDFENPRSMFMVDRRGLPLELADDPRVIRETSNIARKVQQYNFGVLLNKNLFSFKDLPTELLDELERAAGPGGVEFLPKEYVYRVYQNYNITKAIQYWANNPQFKDFLIKYGKDGANQLIESIVAGLQKERDILKQAELLMTEGWLGEAFVKYQTGNSQDGSWFVEKAIHDANYTKALESIDETYDILTTGGLQYNINQQLKERTLFRSPVQKAYDFASRKIKPALPKWSWFGCCSKPNNVKLPATKKPPMRGFGFLELLNLGLTGAAVKDTWERSETTSEALYYASGIIIESIVPPIGGKGDIQRPPPQTGYDPYKNIPGFESRRQYEEWLNEFFKPYLQDLYYQYYLGQLSKAVILNMLETKIRETPALNNLKNLDLNLYNHADDSDPPYNGHKYYPYKQSDAIQTKEFFEQILDSNLFDTITESALQGAEESVGIGGNLILYWNLYENENFYKVVKKRRQEYKLMVKSRELQAAIGPLVSATEDYLSSLSLPDDTNKANCGLFCYPESFSSIRNNNKIIQTIQNDPIIWVQLGPETDPTNGTLKLTVEELQQALQDFENKYYSK